MTFASIPTRERIAGADASTSESGFVRPSGHSPPPAACNRAATLRSHLAEYLIEAWALGMFMISAGIFTVLFDAPASPVSRAIGNADLQRVLIGVAMGLTAMTLIYSPWGKRSGAHMNPAVTLTFLRLGHVTRRDAAFYILAQFVGGTVGVLMVSALLGAMFTEPPVRHVVTVPGDAGVAGALAAEFVISFLMMSMILRVSSSARLMKFTGLFAGILVALWISTEGPLSGMSMNTARTFASAASSGVWTAFWIYVLAPIAGMQAAAAVHVFLRGASSVACAKLLHTADQRCIHCGYEPRSESGPGTRDPGLGRTSTSASCKSQVPGPGSRSTFSARGPT